MITFDPYGAASPVVRVFRVLLPLLLCAGYLAFRVYPATDGRIPLGEVVVMGIVFAGLVLVALIAAADLIYPARIIRADSPSELEITAAITPVADIEATAAQACAAEIRRLDALLRGGEGRIEGDLLKPTWMGPHKSRRSDWFQQQMYGPVPDPIDEPELMTHEFTAMHHTPPRGIPVFRVPEVKQEWVLGDFRWTSRTRTGQLFGELS